VRSIEHTPEKIDPPCLSCRPTSAASRKSDSVARHKPCWR
jgi:hypothetical protein